MNKLNVWRRISHFAFGVMLLVIIIKMFFKQYLGESIVGIMLIGLLALIVALVAETMKYILIKRK